MDQMSVLPQVKRSDLSLWHADCFEVFPSITPKSIHLILADLPYGTTACPWDSVLPLDLLWKEYARIMTPNAAVILTAAQPFTWKLCASNPEWFKYELIWEKTNGTNPLLVNQQPFRAHENILVFYKNQPTYNPQMTYGHACSTAFYDASKTLGEVYTGRQKHRPRLISRHKANTDGSRYPKSIQSFPLESIQTFPPERIGHPTKKPVALMRWLIRSYSNPGDRVLDNTMGFGTTGVACMEERRCFYGIEKEERYFKAAKRAILDSWSLAYGQLL